MVVDWIVAKKNNGIYCRPHTGPRAPVAPFRSAVRVEAWNRDEGTLRYSMAGAPKGLVIDATGYVTGLPTEAGLFDVSVFAELSSGIGGVATVNSKPFKLEVTDCDASTCRNGGLCIDTTPHVNLTDVYLLYNCDLLSLLFFGGFFLGGGFLSLVDAREACFGPCVVTTAYAAVVDMARYTVVGVLSLEQKIPYVVCGDPR